MEYEVQILQSPLIYASVVECRHAWFKPKYSVMDVQVQVLSEVRYSLVAQLVRVSACHAEGRGFESRLDCILVFDTALPLGPNPFIV